MDPIFKWPGGKRNLLKTINPLLPPNRFGTYYEPFLGGGALFFHLRPKNAVISDNNKILMKAYQDIKERPNSVWSDLTYIVNAYRSSPDKEAFYYTARSYFNELDGDSASERTAYFVFLNKTGFNGLFRVNSKGEYNVPFGDYPRPSFPSLKKIDRISKALAKASLSVDDFTSIHPSRNDFVYFDPPYHQTYNQYTADKFDEFDQKRLAVFVRELGEQGVRCAVSNNDTPFIRTLYKGCQFHEVKTRRMINRDGDGRHIVTELFITNYEVRV